MRARTDPVTVACVAVGLALLVAAGLMGSRPSDAREWTIPAIAEAATTAPEAMTATGGGESVETEGIELTGATRMTLPSASQTWVTEVASATGIPPSALRAYATATLFLEAEQPSCRFGWTTLAAIGHVESAHGTHGGATLGADGRPSILIIGPPLDGKGVAAIAATPESTVWHGDPVWDHAIGPMQFLPSSWERWAADADGDGVADPHDVDDAALAAARYLCAGERDLGTAEGWWAAVLSYNHSEAYVAEVLALADAYARAADGP